MTEQHPCIVYVVDDDAAMRDSMTELVESVGMQAETYPSAQAFLDLCEPRHPCCLVLDVRMPGMSGLTLLEQLQGQGAPIPVILLTSHGDVPMAVDSMKAGAFDFVQKPYREQALLDRIQTALSLDFDRQSMREVEHDLDQCVNTLTPRELNVFDRMLAGNTSKDIARALEISPRTAEVHRRNVLRKFKVHSTKALIALFFPAPNAAQREY